MKSFCPSFTARKSFVQLISPVPSTCVVLREARFVETLHCLQLSSCNKSFQHGSTRFGTKIFCRVLSLSLKASAKFSELLSEFTSNFLKQDYFPGNRYLVNYHVTASIIAILPLQQFHCSTRRIKWYSEYVSIQLFPNVEARKHRI